MNNVFVKFNLLIIAMICFESKADMPYQGQALMLPWGQAKSVDRAWGRDQLSEFRNQVRLDTCLQPDRRNNSFGLSIEAAVRASLDAKKIKTNSAIQRGYGLPIEDRSEAVSLLSHPLCEQDRADIAHMLGEDFVPDAASLKYLKDFASESNRERSSALRGDRKSLERFAKRWTVLMGCLAYAESLDIINPEVEKEADENFETALLKQGNVAKFFVGEFDQIQRPKGVWFGADRNGNYYIKLRAFAAKGTLTEDVKKELDRQYPTWPVVGLFQFNASTSGNAGPCVEQWNEMFSGRRTCQIDSSSNDQLLMGFASHGQSLNAYCGVQKIVQSFNSQINTVHATGTDRSNTSDRQKIKNPRNRCVSLVSRAGRGNVYSHFGPLRNSVKDNLKKVLECTKNALK